MKLIKRYKNRKLYDTDESCYLTLKQITKLIRSGVDVRVRDQETNRDITAETLMQIVFQNAGIVPTYALLRSIIAEGDGTIIGYIKTHIKGEKNDFYKHDEIGYQEIF